MFLLILQHMSLPTISYSNVSIEMNDNTITGSNNVLSAFSDIIIGITPSQTAPSSSPILSPPSLASSSPPPTTDVKPGVDSLTGLKYDGFSLPSVTSPIHTLTNQWMQNAVLSTSILSTPQVVQGSNNYLSKYHPLLYGLMDPMNDKSGVKQWFERYPEQDDLDDLTEGEDNEGESPVAMRDLEKSGTTRVEKRHKISLMSLRVALGRGIQEGESVPPVVGEKMMVTNSTTIQQVAIPQQRRKLGIVQPVDGRVQVHCGTTDNWAWQTIVSIGGYCTGTLVSPDTVLTAAHCIYDTDTSSWVEPPFIEIHPCSSTDSAESFSWKKIRTFKGWTRSGKRGYDIAVIKLDGNPGYTDGWKSFGTRSSLDSSWVVNIAGYPGDKPYQTMWTDANRLCSSSDSTTCVGNPKSKVFYYLVDTRGGQSGSGVYAYWPSTGKRLIIGVHTSWSGLLDDTALNTTWNRAARMRSSVFQSFCDFIDNPSVC